MLGAQRQAYLGIPHPDVLGVIPSSTGIITYYSAGFGVGGEPYTPEPRASLVALYDLDLDPKHQDLIP